MFQPPADSSSATTAREENSPIRVNNKNGNREGLERSATNFKSGGNGAIMASFGEEKTKQKKKWKIAKLWGKLDMDWHTALLMMKAGLPPTIGLAIQQSRDVADTFSTLGYLVAIVSILGFCIQPRAKFIQTMILNILATFLGAAVCLLMVWTGVQARINTTPAGAPPQQYNSSQSAILGVWLFFQIWLVNSAKGKFPQFVFPTIIYSNFVNVSAGFGTQFRTEAQAKLFIQQLLEAFLAGLAIATVVSLLVFPVTSRKVAIRGFGTYITALRGALQAHKKYLESLETANVFSQWRSRTNTGSITNEKPQKRKPEIEALKKYTATLTQLQTKLRGDLWFAKREIAHGKLTPDDFEALFKLFRGILMPLVGLSSLGDVFERIAEQSGWDPSLDDEFNDEDPDALHEQAVAEWHSIMETIHEPIETIMKAMDGGLEHTMLKLLLIKPRKEKKGAHASDTEAKGDLVSPGDPGFSDYLERQSDAFYNGKESTLRQWVATKGVQLPDDYFQNVDQNSLPDMAPLTREPTYMHQRNQRQLYVILYVVSLIHSVSRAILALARFADSKDLSSRPKRFIFPGRKRLKKWLKSLMAPQGSSSDSDDANVAGFGKDYTVVHMGEAYRKRKDPEHLPPENAFERFGNGIRKIARFLRSPESAFGFRCACATMTIAIVGFLADTQRFFIRERMVWAMIMVSISMTPTAGQSVWAFFLRILGTCIAMVIAFLTWYIPGKHTAGILIFLWFFISLTFWIPIKRPDYIIVGIITVITTTLIVGYQLQVRVLGREVAESNGQPAYAIHILGPYRLACVAGGLAVAFIWTFFPYPISEHSALRTKLGGALHLSANYYSVIHETVMGRIRGDEGDPTDKDAPAYKLTKVRNKVFGNQMLLLQSLRTHSTFVRWEFPLGGKFPKKEYDRIIQLVTNITNYSALISYASEAFINPIYSDPMATDPSHIQWFHDFRRIVNAASLTSHEVTSTLALLSSSLTSGQPLPPYLKPPQAYSLSRKLEQIDRDILSVKHIAEPGYAAFAVLQISTSCISMDLEKLLRAVRRLVGELDFSFRVLEKNDRMESRGSSVWQGSTVWQSSSEWEEGKERNEDWK